MYVSSPRHNAMITYVYRHQFELFTHKTVLMAKEDWQSFKNKD